jgi:hypothetical protein
LTSKYFRSLCARRQKCFKLIQILEHSGDECRLKRASALSESIERRDLENWIGAMNSEEDALGKQSQLNKA